MHAAPADLDPVRPARCFVHRQIGVELRSQLIEVCDPRVDAYLNLASISRFLTQYDAYQCRLARAVRSDDADTIARAQQSVEATDEHETTVRLLDAMQVQDGPVQ